jgi:lipopolysaccharide transport system permease protein
MTKAATINPADRDILSGITRWRVWLMLGWHDIDQRYRRTKLGPLWFTLTTFVMVASLGFVFSKVLGNDMSTYVPFLAAGLASWGLISQIAIEAPTAFVNAENIINSINLPFTVHVLRVLVRQLVIYFHNLLALVLIALWYELNVSYTTLLVIPGLFIVLLNGLWVGLFLATLGTRFRDLGPIVTNVLQIVFFLTPIVWQPGAIGAHRYVVDWNPAYHLISVIRSPLLGEVPSALSYAVSVALFAVGALITLYFFRRFRRRVSYWL